MQELIGEVRGLVFTAEALRLDLLGKLALAAVLGGLIGWDREASGKPAGLRTNMLICIGATLISDLSIRFSEFSPTELVRSDPARLVAQVVSGVGFLGAGTIIQARGNVTGLTTAATLWVVAAIGIGVGSGHYVEAVGATILVLLTLVPLGILEKHFRRTRRGRQVRVEVDRAPKALERLESLLEERGLTVEAVTVEQSSEHRLTLSLEVRGDEAVFRSVRQELAERPEVHFLKVE